MNMALKQAGRPARDYQNDRKKIAVRLYEGDLVYAKGFDKDGYTKYQHSVTAPMNVGEYVELHPDSTPRNIIVKKAAANSEKVIGRLITDPHTQAAPDWKNGDKNRLPTQNTSWGDYAPRTGTVELFGHSVDEVQLVEENAAIAPYDYIKFVDQDFDKATNETCIISLVKVAALESGKIPVLSIPYFYGKEAE